MLENYFSIVLFSLITDSNWIPKSNCRNDQAKQTSVQNCRPNC